MAHLRYRDTHAPSRGALYVVIGALVGLAAGVLVAQRYGGIGALSTRVRDRIRRGGTALEDRLGAGFREYEEGDEYGEEYGDQFDELSDDLSPEEELEERVLEAYRNDPVLSERAVDIGAIGEGIIELTGWVHGHDEVTHAVTVARGVPDVVTVVNRLPVREEEEELDEAARDDDTENPEGRMGGHWEGQQVGTGRRRQGTSADPDRHADPKPVLEDRWLDTAEAIREAADDIEGIAERRNRQKGPREGDRTGGAPVAPTGVPKADHVADPTDGRAD